MSRVDYAAQAAAHIEEAIVANQNGKWETARFELKLAEVKALLALTESKPRENNLAPLAATRARRGRTGPSFADTVNSGTVTVQQLESGFQS